MKFTSKPFKGTQKDFRCEYQELRKQVSSYYKIDKPFRLQAGTVVLQELYKGTTWQNATGGSLALIQSWLCPGKTYRLTTLNLKLK